VGEQVGAPVEGWIAAISVECEQTGLEGCPDSEGTKETGAEGLVEVGEGDRMK